jgi:hypothetical protein
MSYNPALSHFDLDMKRGAAGELFVLDICKMLAEGSGTIEVKTDYRFTEKQRFYIEIECRGRDGKWRPSGLAVTKAKLWAIVVGKQPNDMLPMMFVFDTHWLQRAAALAAKDQRNLRTCDYGKNPTRGVLVYINHFVRTMDPSKEPPPDGWADMWSKPYIGPPP